MLSKMMKVPGIKEARHVIVAVFGSTLLIIGILMIVLPGPAFIVLPFGLAILATEFVWARRWLKKLRGLARRVGAVAKPRKRKAALAAVQAR